MSILMNIPTFIAFLRWRYECGGCDGILEKSQAIILRCVEMVAQLRLLTIHHLAIFLPHRWLAANCGSLGEWDFGVADMAWTVDLLDAAFKKIIKKPELFLDDDFMMNIFKPIADKIPPFQDYLEHMFENKTSNPIGCWEEADKVIPYDEVRAAVFFPTRVDIRQTHDLCLELAVRWAASMRREFRDERKNTHKYLSASNGVASLAMISEEMRTDGFGIDASNSVCESLHAASTDMLVIFGTIRIDHCCAIGMTRSNNDFGRGHKTKVSGRKQTSTKKRKRKGGAYEIGEAHKLSENARKALMRFSKEEAKAQKERFDKYLNDQFKYKMDQEEEKREKFMDGRMRAYIDAKFQFDLYHSPRRWLTADQARREWAALGSETERLRIMRQQLLMYSLGLAIKEAYIAWSDDGHTYTSAELLEWLCETVLPLAKKLDKEKRLPTEPVIQGSCLPALPRLGTTSNLGVGCEATEGEEMESFKKRCLEEYARKVESGEIDILSEKQALIAPPRDRTMRGYEVEMFLGIRQMTGIEAKWLGSSVGSRML